MDRTAEIILSLGIATTMTFLAIAVASHISNAKTVEFRTPYYAINSSRNLSLDE